MVAAAVHEMSMAIQEVATNALATSKSSADANLQAINGRTLVCASVESIKGVSLSVENSGEIIDALHIKSDEISKVLVLIQSIAAQTNLLALNAAIEAARAGDAGRGFAVVADEVRGLAWDTQAATESIGSMIEAIQSSATAAVKAMHQSRVYVQGCVEKAEKAGQALASIAEKAHGMASGNEQISTATEEQTAVASEISQNVSQLKNSIQEVISGAEQCLVANRELAQMASRLHNQSQHFTV